MKLKFNLLLLGLTTVIFFSCSEYQKVVKSKDREHKYEMAVKYYEQGSYFKSMPLMEELIPLYRGSEKAETLDYYYAFSQYNLGDYTLAAYYFKKFTTTYSSSDKVEECAFMAAYCNYKLSPQYSLDQVNTYTAIEELELYTNAYPKSNLIDSCNTLIDELRAKLEKKSFEMANLYYKTQYYQSAIVAFETSLKEYPNSERKEEAYFLIFKSTYIIAKNSVGSKKMERIDDCIDAYFNFVDFFPNSDMINEAEKLYAEIVEEKEKLTSSN